MAGEHWLAYYKVIDEYGQTCQKSKDAHMPVHYTFDLEATIDHESSSNFGRGGGAEYALNYFILVFSKDLIVYV
jgi:hypothetical protein